jgi:hypothetical protein
MDQQLLRRVRLARIAPGAAIYLFWSSRVIDRLVFRVDGFFFGIFHVAPGALHPPQLA